MSAESFLFARILRNFTIPGNLLFNDLFLRILLHLAIFILIWREPWECDSHRRSNSSVGHWWDELNNVDQQICEIIAKKCSSHVVFIFISYRQQFYTNITVFILPYVIQSLFQPILVENYSTPRLLMSHTQYIEKAFGINSI